VHHHLAGPWQCTITWLGHDVTRVQALIEGLGIMLQKSTAPPPMGMPPMDMPQVDAPKPPSEVLVGGASAPSGELDPNLIHTDSSADKANEKKVGLLGMSLFGSG
jgi:hypothetical protein